MSNELLFILSTIIDILFVFFAARRGVEWLLGTVAVNLLLVGIVGAKLITVFGLTTNVGNVFYACVFLATYFLLERYGRAAGLKTIWYGTIFLFMFTGLSQLVVQFSGLPVSHVANDAIASLLSFSARVTFASVLAFIFAQYVNVFLYEWIKARTHGRHMWLRVNGANFASQLIDSLLFFSIAFIDLPGPLLVQAILTGWLIKTAVGSLGTPFLYLNVLLDRRKI